MFILPFTSHARRLGARTPGSVTSVRLELEPPTTYVGGAADVWVRTQVPFGPGFCTTLCFSELDFWLALVTGSGSILSGSASELVWRVRGVSSESSIS